MTRAANIAIISANGNLFVNMNSLENWTTHPAGFTKKTIRMVPFEGGSQKIGVKKKFNWTAVLRKTFRSLFKTLNRLKKKAGTYIVAHMIGPKKAISINSFKKSCGFDPVKIRHKTITEALCTRTK